MNLDEAIAAHIDWRLGLEARLQEPGGVMDLEVERLTADHLCPLGRWIRQEGAIYAGWEEWLALDEAHADFHRIAGQVVGAIRSGRHADLLLAHRSPFDEASRRVLTAIRCLRERMRDLEGVGPA